MLQEGGIPRGDKLVDEKGNRVGIVFHCFRHTRVSIWVEMGYNDEIVRRAKGHKNLEAYQRYAKPGRWSVMKLVNRDPDVDKPKVQKINYPVKDTVTSCFYI